MTTQRMRNARDLVRLAKLTKEKVTISVKEKGKPRQVSQELEYDAVLVSPPSKFVARRWDWGASKHRVRCRV